MFRFPPLTPFVKKLLMGLGGFFLLQVLLDNWVFQQPELLRWLALSPSSPDVGLAWQWMSYVLVHPIRGGALLSLMISLLFIWLMMSPFEARFGQKRAAQLAAVSVIGGGIPALLFGLVIPNAQPLYGTGPLVLGTLSASVWSVRHLPQVQLFGVVPVKPIHLIWGVVGLSVVMFLIDKSVVGLMADLGAIGAGIGLVHWMSRPPAQRKPKKHKSARERAPFTVIEGGGTGDDDERPKWLN